MSWCGSFSMQQPVLVGARLGLVAVDDEVARPHVRAGRSPTSRRRGSRRRRDRAGSPTSPPRSCAPGVLASAARRPCVAAGRLVALERVRVVVAEARGDDLRGVGDGHELRRLLRCGSATPAPGRRPGRRGPAALSAGMCWRMRASVPCGGISSSRRPARRSSIELVELVVADAVEVAVVHLEARRLGAGGDALDVLDREHPVGRGAAGLDAERLLGVVEQLVAAHELAGDVRADVDRGTCRPARA